jgi:hypothetical protein
LAVSRRFAADSILQSSAAHQFCRKHPKWL